MLQACSTGKFFIFYYSLITQHDLMNIATIFRSIAVIPSVSFTE